MKETLTESVLSYSRGPSPPLDEGTAREVQGVSVAEAVRILEDALGQRQGLRAVQLLHSMR